VLAGAIVDAARRNVLLRERNFFGVREVRDDLPKRMRVLMHGTTRHGAQSLDRGKQREPLSYYNRQGPLGDVFRAFPPAAQRRIAVVGLGAGTMAAYAGAGERWTFFEIDPDIARVARDTTFFTYLRNAPAEIEILLGDGRLSLAAAPDRHFDVVVLDAFSSDAIPTHLLTREALRIYQSKLADGGVLVFHLSNRYLDLEPVLGRLIEDAGAAGLIRVNTARNKELLASGGDPSIWAAVGQSSSSVSALQGASGWGSLRTRAGVGLWTDDFTNIFSVFRWPGRGQDE
jgi:SAM-dependent methyltransferase